MGNFTRREALATTMGAGAAAIAASAATYKFRHRIDAFRETLRDPPAVPTFGDAARDEYARQAAAIRERQRRQTAETVAALKRKYEHPILGKFDVWQLIERLSVVHDPTDMSLLGASQFLHLQQCLSAMERNGVEDSDLLLVALLHDLGKVFLLTEEGPENVVCPINRIGEAVRGLDNNIFQFGHAEMIYSRIKDHVPEHVAWTVRYHTINLDQEWPNMDEKDRKFADRYLTAFRKFDAGYKSPFFIPRIQMDRYRDLVHEFFPRPILF